MYRRAFLTFVLLDLCFVVPRVTCFLEYLLEGRSEAGRRCFVDSFRV